jgi:signal transduction histidine kinase/FixJ family two-component response regulator
MNDIEGTGGQASAEWSVQLDRLRLGLAMSAARLIVWTWNLATDEVDISAEALRMMNLPPDLHLGSEAFALMHPDDIAPSLARTERVRQGEQDVEIEFRMPDGEGGWRCLVGRATRFGEGDAPLVCCVAFDDTERRTQAEALRQSEIDESAAADEKARFLAMMSHEIRTPMNGVIGMVELLTHTALDDRQHRMLDTCRESAHVLMALLNDVLDFSKMEAGKVELERAPFSPRRMMDDLGELLRAQAMPRGLQVIVGIDEGVPPLVVGDRVRLRQILANLGGNAVKFTERGRVGLSVAPDRPRAGDPRAYLRFEVVDTGIGIAPDALATLFEPFRQADASTARRFGGTGLGLSIVRSLVDLMDGVLECESREGEGTRFRVVLPFAVAEADAEEPGARRASIPVGEAPSLEEAAATGRLVLLADDNATNREVISQQLALLGYACEAVEDGELAWRHVERQRGRYALLLTDVQMPTLDGLALATRIRARERATDATPLPIVAITASTSAEEGERCLAAGMDAFLGKPVQLDALRDALARALPAIPGFDALARLVHDDRDKLRRILGAFATDTRGDLERWAAATRPLDRSVLASLAHRLRAACLHLGAGDAGAAFAAIERAATDPAVDDAAFTAAAERARIRAAGLLADIERALGGLSSPA